MSTLTFILFLPIILLVWIACLALSYILITSLARTIREGKEDK